LSGTPHGVVLGREEREEMINCLSFAKAFFLNLLLALKINFHFVKEPNKNSKILFTNCTTIIVIKGTS